MENIEEFEIHVDIDDRQYLHDYVSGERLSHPAGGWNLALLREHGQVDQYMKEEDENAMVRVKMMDDAFSDTKKLEKKKKKEGDSKEEEEEAKTKDATETLSEELVSLVFDHRSEVDGPPRRVLPVFTPGETFKGNLVLKLKKEMKASQITVQFDGYAKVRIRVYHQYGYADVAKEESFVKMQIQCWSSSEGQNISAGTHRYPFQFQIPESAPQACPPLMAHCSNWGHLVYRLKGIIEQDKMLKSGDIATHQGIWVDGLYDIGKNLELSQPVSVEEKVDAGLAPFWKSGKLAVRASLPHGGFLRGESVPLHLEIDNQTKGGIKAVNARIRLHGKIQHGEGRMCLRSSVNVKGEKVSSEGPIAAGMCPTFNWTLPWDFSQCSVDPQLMPVENMDKSMFIDVNYEVHIVIKRSGLHRNVDLHIPITIGNQNSRAESKLYPSLK